MYEPFDAFVAERGLAIWRAGARLRGQRHHGGGFCPVQRPTLLGGAGCSHECEELFQEALLDVAHRLRPPVWTYPERGPRRPMPRRPMPRQPKPRHSMLKPPRGGQRTNGIAPQ